MRRTPLLLALAAAALLSSSPAQAQSAKALEDFRCVLIGMIGSDVDETDKTRTSMMLTMYFLGRLDAREPNFDGKRNVAKEFDKLMALDTDAVVKATSDCYDAFRESQFRLEEWGED